MFKVVKDNWMLKFLNKMMKNGSSIEWLFMFVLFAVLLIHLSTCLWVLIPEIEDNTPDWMYQMRIYDYDTFD